MSKKYSFIPSLGFNNQITANNKNLIPHPKSNSLIQNPIILYKKGRNNNNKRINPQNNSINACCKETENIIPEKNFSNNTMINFPKRQNIANNHILQIEEKSSLNIKENMENFNSSKNGKYS